MGKNILVVVDMQNDFIDGALGTKEAVEIVDNVKNYIEKFDGEVVFTRDTHFEDYLDTMEGKKLPVKHCIKDTKGWEIREELDKLRTSEMKVFDKLTFGSVELGEYVKGIEGLEKVTMVGLCTDICVISNALLIKANVPECVIEVVENCCAGVTVESHNNALAAMKMCHIDVI